MLVMDQVTVISLCSQEIEKTRHPIHPGQNVEDLLRAIGLATKGDPLLVFSHGVLQAHQESLSKFAGGKLLVRYRSDVLKQFDQCIRAAQKLKDTYGLPEYVKFRKPDLSNACTAIPEAQPQTRRKFCAERYKEMFTLLQTPPSNFNAWRLINNYNFKENKGTKLDMPESLQVELITPAETEQFDKSVVWNVMAVNVEVYSIRFNWNKSDASTTISGEVELENKTDEPIDLQFHEGLMWAYRDADDRADRQDVVTKSMSFRLPQKSKSSVSLHGFCANKLTKSPNGRKFEYDLTPWRLRGFKDELDQTGVWGITH